jgi:hypothetical protein
MKVPVGTVKIASTALPIVRPVPRPLRLTTAAAAAAIAAAVVASCSVGSSSQAGAAPKPARYPPVVMLVFDEFSSTSLLDAHGHIDAVRYPNFARLARDGTWFPYATASLDETARAMRSLFTGRTTWRFAHPTYSAEPRNLFTLLGRRYRMGVSEEVSSICPPSLCRGSRQPDRRTVLHRLSSGRQERFARWLRSVRPSGKPTLYLKHLLFPHGPWRYLPSGRQFEDTASKKLLSWNIQHFNGWLVQRSYQRHLLQLGFTDRLLGQALDRLEATGLYNRSLVVVTADNGESFGRLGNGHEIGSGSEGDIALTPLIVKLPFQQARQTVQRHVRVIDVLPTIARITHTPLRWRVEGRSLFGPGASRIPASTVLVQRSGRRVDLSFGALRRRAASTYRLKARLFGEGNGAPGLYGIGPFKQLHDTPLDRWPKLPGNGTRALPDSPGRFRNVRLSSGLLPVNLMGRISGRDAGKAIDLAVAVNGTVVATAPTFSTLGRRLFSVQIPEASLHEGGNRVQFFAISRGSALRPL